MLKKFFCLFLVLFLIMTTGCNNSKKFMPLLNNITFEAKINYNDEKFICTAESQNNILKLTVTAPKSISGLMLLSKKDVVTIEFNGIKHDFYINTLPNDAMFTIITDVITDVSAKKSTVLSNENYIIEEKINDYFYTFVFSPTGLPISLTVKEKNLYIDFCNVTINNKAKD